MANNMGIITESFPARERGRALGLLASGVALGMMCGPVLGGFIVSALPWEYIFLINVPVGVASLFVGFKTLPHAAPQSAGRRLDVLGSVLLVPGNLRWLLSRFGEQYRQYCRSVGGIVPKLSRGRLPQAG